MDIDIWPIRTDSAQCTAGRITWQSSTYDRAATRKLVNELREAAPGHVKLIYFNDPELISAGPRSDSFTVRSASAMSGLMPSAWIEVPLGV